MATAWERAVTGGDVETVRQLLRSGETLLEGGADLNVTAKYNLSALMLSVIAGHVAIARLLARAGADLTLRGSGAPGFTGQTAYDLAVARQLEELYAELEPRGT